MKPHGIDFGTWTQWAEPDNPPKPIDFVIAGCTWGDSENQTYQANKLQLQAVDRLMTYHGYDNSSVTAMANVIIRTAKEVGSRAVWVDFENSSYYNISSADVPKLKQLVSLLKQEFDRVGIYTNHDHFMLVQNADAEFAKNVEWWLAFYYPDPETIDNYAKVYQTQIKRPFSSVRFLQYTDRGDAQLYGAINDKKSMDLNVFQGTMEELDAWLGITEEPEPPTPPTAGNWRRFVLDLFGAVPREDFENLQEVVAQHDARIAELEDGPAPPPAGYIPAVVHRDGKNVYLSYFTEKNSNGVPIWKFYPSDSAPVNERVFVPSGAVLYIKDQTKGDGGNVAWKVDMSRIPLAPGSAPVPPVQLYIMEKFL